MAWGPLSGSASQVIVSAGPADVTYQGAHINRSSAGNDTIDLEFNGAVVGSDLTTGVTVGVREGSSGSYSTLDLGSVTASIVDTDYIRYTLTGTVNTFQSSHEVEVSISSAAANLVDIGATTTLTNSSTLNLTQGGIAAWHLDEASGATRVDSINSYDLTDVNTVTQTAAVSSATVYSAGFDGVDQYLKRVDTAALDPGDAQLWISAWFYTTDNSHQQIIVSKWDGILPEKAYLLDYTSAGTPTQGFRFLVSSTDAGSGDEQSIAKSEIVADDDAWYHVIGYHNPSTNQVGIIVRKKGAASATVEDDAHTGGINANSRDFVIGNSPNLPGSSYMEGRVDAVYFVVPSDAWSSDEIEDLYNNGDGKQWPFIPDHFTPSDISDLLQFLESDTGVTTTTGEKVTVWADEKSDAARNVTQTSDASRPVEEAEIFGTDPGLSFDGDNDRLDRANESSGGINFNYDDPFYVIVGIQMDSDFSAGSVGQLAGQFGTSNPAGWVVRYDAAGKPFIGLQASHGAGTYTWVHGDTVLAASTKYLIEFWSTSASGTGAASDLNISVNGSAESLTTVNDGLSSTSIVSTNPYNIGERHDGAHAVDGYYACVGIYGSVPTDGERTSLRSYLNDKYGFTDDA